MSVNIVRSLEGQGSPQLLQRYKTFLTGSVARSARSDVKIKQRHETFIHLHGLLQSAVLVLQMDFVFQTWCGQSCHCKLCFTIFVVNGVGSTSLFAASEKLSAYCCSDSISFVE